MVSFDVSSLFTNVPLDDTMEFLKYHLRNINLDMPFKGIVPPRILKCLLL